MTSLISDQPSFSSYFVPVIKIFHGFKAAFLDVETNRESSFGPVSAIRKTDFTILFEQSVLLILPIALPLLIFVIKFLARDGRRAASTSISSPEKHIEASDAPPSQGPIEAPRCNHLIRFKALLALKITTYLASFSLLVGLAAISSGPALPANIAGFTISALSIAVVGTASFRNHRVTWTSGKMLTLVCMGQSVVFAIRARTERSLSRETGNTNVAFALLVSTAGLSAFASLLECIPRIDSKTTEEINAPPDISSNLFSYCTFSFAQPTFQRAFRLYREKNTSDYKSLLWPLADDLRSERLVKHFEEAWAQEWDRSKATGTRPRFWRLLFSLYTWSCLPSLILVIVFSISQYASPAILDGLLDWIERTRSIAGSSLFEGFQYALGFVAVRTIASFLFSVALYQLNRQAGRARVALMAAVYRKSIRLAPEERGVRTLGEIVSHITVDAESIQEGAWYIQTTVAFAPSIGLGVYFLHKQLQWVAFLGLGWIIVVLGLTQGFNSSAMGREFGNRMAQVDKRTSLVNEVIENIKIVKFSAWESPLIQKILALRRQELKHLHKMSIILGRLIFPSNLVKQGALIIMFSVYTARIGVPTPSTIFVSLTVFDIMYSPIEQVGLALNWFMTLKKALTRVAQFLSAKELAGSNMTVDDDLDGRGLAASIRDAQFSWKKANGSPSNSDSIDEKQLLLEIPSLDIHKSELFAIVGRVGSGKSSLAQGLLGQMHLLQGTVRVASRKVAYCPQTPFILAATVRDNILGFDLPLNQQLLDKVIDACALRPDLDILPGGLRCEIGERGVNLSGGQRSRVALARACYSVLSGQARLLVLDSVLEAVDAHTDTHIWENVLGREGILKDHTRILITHAVHHLHDVDRICYLEAGRVAQVGTQDELMSLEGPYRRLIVEFSRRDNEKKTGSPQAKVQEISKSRVSDEAEGTLVQGEAIKSGRIAGKVYGTFFSYAGMHRIVLLICFYLCNRGLIIGSQFWLSHWINSDDAAHSRRSAFYIGIYSIFPLTSAFMVPIAIGLSGTYVILPAAEKVYEKMLTSVLRAPLSWFHTTPTGRITNRLTSDASHIDWDLVGLLATVLSSISAVSLGILASAIATKGFLLIFILLLGPVYWLMFLYYTATSRTVRRLDAGITRAPLVSQASETVQGAAVITAIGSSTYFDSFFTKLDMNQSAKLLQQAAEAWLLVRVEMFASILVFAVSSLAVGLRTKISPAIAGLAISNTLAMAVYLNNLLQRGTDVETAAVHVERCIEFAEDLPSERFDAPTLPDAEKTPEQWPTTGSIQFKDVSARYRPELPLTLSNISLDIPSGTKVAIVGRTGSGKSSLTLTLFRLLELESGSIEIDGVNINSVGLEQLRQGISIIPQENQALSGTIRSNLSPFGGHSDEELWDALEGAGLKPTVSSLEGKLDAEVQTGGRNFSAGQLQQLGLARALLTKSRVVVLDEATSSLDLQTDAAIQTAIRERFAQATVITIAHRLRTIMDCDLIVVMKDGSIAETGSPGELLARPESLFASLASEAGEGE